MKRIATIILIILCTLLLGGCRIPIGSGMTSGERLKLRSQQILDAIEQRNNGALQSLFSKDAQEKAINLEESIDALFDYFQGEVLSIEFVRLGSGTGMTYRYYEQQFIVRTDIDTYYFSLVESQGVVFDFNKDNYFYKGLFSLGVKKGSSMGFPTPMNVISGVFVDEPPDSKLEIFKGEVNSESTFVLYWNDKTYYPYGFMENDSDFIGKKIGLVDKGDGNSEAVFAVNGYPSNQWVIRKYFNTNVMGVYTLYKEISVTDIPAEFKELAYPN
jgi:hypothetical protein